MDKKEREKYDSAKLGKFVGFSWQKSTLEKKTNDSV
jgi:hypothetical protein